MDVPHTKMPECSPPLRTYCIVQHTQNFNPPPQWRNSPSWARAPSLPWLHDHTQTHHTLVALLLTSDRPDAKTPIWQHSTHNRQTSMPAAEFEPTIPADSRLTSHGHWDRPKILNAVCIRVAQLVEALRYKPEGLGFDSQWCHWNFSLT
jgi:hypothetical protein